MSPPRTAHQGPTDRSRTAHGALTDLSRPALAAVTDRTRTALATVTDRARPALAALTNRSRTAVAAASLAVLACASPLHAGMGFNPVTFRSNPEAELRLASLSFFIVVTLLLVPLIAWVWNTLRKEVPGLPKLSWRAALGLVVLWGLLVCVILSMTTGARAVLTPGSWERAGVQYRLTAPAPDPLEIRRQSLATLHQHLTDYAGRNDGALPAGPFMPGVPADAWLSAHISRAPLIYIPGRRLTDSPPTLLAYESAQSGRPRYALLTDGSIHLFDDAMIRLRLYALPDDKP